MDGISDVAQAVRVVGVLLCDGAGHGGGGGLSLGAVLIWAARGAITNGSGGKR